MTVAAYLQSTTNPAVFAAGDAANTIGRPLTPRCRVRRQSRCAQHDQGHHYRARPNGRATTVFAIPELDRVGLLEHEAAYVGHEIAVRSSDTSDWYSTYRVAETTAAAKIIIDPASDQILGAHLLGPGYSELINTFGLAIKLGLTTRQLKSVTTTYPSLGSDLGSLL
ncbi:hypothetical protein MOX01_38010 [Microbacterium oxydans]|uniref:NAD(P)/FAD-dependent oxidoreductase n=1 Tax=Microbacterium oxydans TaxID=82380 RepID=UPI001174D8E7|nr:NAD(P)/FAD-dependent oxidoreductase [Microbacterium oxydans]GED40659.1 hypothetical protein MOX01_38010 [Microbacterium oxydans]